MQQSLFSPAPFALRARAPAPRPTQRVVYAAFLVELEAYFDGVPSTIDLALHDLAAVADVSLVSDLLTELDAHRRGEVQCLGVAIVALQRACAGGLPPAIAYAA